MTNIISLKSKERLIANFMIAYHGGDRPSYPEAEKAHRKKWQAWVGKLGDKVVNPGTPLMNSKLLTSTNVEDDTDGNSMKGFAIVKAENMDEATVIAKADLFLAMNGTIRISEMMEI